MKTIERVISKRKFKFQKLHILLLLMGFITISSCTADAVERIFDELEELNEPNNVSVDNLKGDWERVSSSNSSANGMIIRVVKNSGEVTNKSQSPFDVGDIKWKDIDAVDEENYIHEELGSDGNYYNGTMIFSQDDTLRISVQASGAGAVQKWVRK
ncbi:MAG: hypothetical protein AB8B59_18630 [Maribacter sp.]